MIKNTKVKSIRWSKVFKRTIIALSVVLAAFVIPSVIDIKSNSVIAAVNTSSPNASMAPTVSPSPTKTPEDSVVSREELEKKDFLSLKDTEKIILEFTEKSYAVIEDNKVDLNVNTNIPEKFMSLKYSIKGYCAGLTDSGYNKTDVSVNGYNQGEVTVVATLTVEYCDSYGVNIGQKTITAEAKVSILPINNFTLNVGEQSTYNYTKYMNYSGMTYILSNPAVATINQSGVLTAAAEGFTEVYLTDSKDVKINVGSVTINKLGIYFTETVVSRAVGSSAYALALNNVPAGYSIKWSSSNVSIARVDQLGNVTPVSVGDAVITASAESASGIKVPFKCTFSVTNPKLNITKTNLAKGYDLALNISGTTGKAEWTSSLGNIATAYSANYYSSFSIENQSVPTATVHAIKTGKTVISVLIDGITLSCNVTVTNPQISKSFYVISKSTKSALKLKGINTYSQIKYISANKSVASVSGKGVVKSKKYGFALIKIEVDGASLTASINVGTKNGVKAVLNALKVEGAVYSQARRMRKGYYDCSSLVWRTYSPVGAYFGSRNNAPVAANEANYCVKHKKTVSKKYVNKLNKLRPGDLFFFKGKSNGRYKNIYHVAIYMGQEGTSYFGSNYTVGRIIHANGVLVTQSYMYNQNNIAVVGRVFK